MTPQDVPRTRLRLVAVFATVALVGMSFTAFAQPVEPEQPSLAASTAGPCGIAQPVFCETFDQAFPVGGSRSGRLDGKLWGASRILGAVSLGGNLLNSASPSTMQACGGSSYTAQPGSTDIIVCNGQLRESQYDEHGVTTLALYPKQPFDFAGRTGVVTFDVSNDTSGSHGAWPEFWITDQPVPAPFTHSNPCDMCSVPRNGFGIDLSAGIAFNQGFGGDCVNDGTRRWTVAGVKTFSNYVEREINLFSSPDFHAMGCVRQPAGPDGPLNHVEVRVSQSQISVWATHPGETQLHHLADIGNLNLSFTRGLIWLEDAHYNAEKAADPSTRTPNLANHTFTWDNVGFDGPATYRDISLDVLDAMSPTNVNTDAPGLTGKLLNLGWATQPAAPVTLTTADGFTQQQIDMSTASGRGPLLMFNMGDNNDGKGLQTINYSVNGHAHSSQLPFSTVGTAYHSIALPVPFSDLVAGPQTIKLSANNPMMVTNVNLVLLAAAPVPDQPIPTDPTPTPTATPSVVVPSATATSTAIAETPVPTATATATPAPTPAPDSVCEVLVIIDGKLNQVNRPSEFCTDQQ